RPQRQRPVHQEPRHRHDPERRLIGRVHPTGSWTDCKTQPYRPRVAMAVRERFATLMSSSVTRLLSTIEAQQPCDQQQPAPVRPTSARSALPPTYFGVLMSGRHPEIMKMGRRAATIARAARVRIEAAHHWCYLARFGVWPGPRHVSEIVAPLARGEHA